MKTRGSKMETKKLVAMLEECQKELKDAGAYGI